MITDLSLRITGQAGQGVQTVGRLLAEAAWQSGCHVQLINDFESRIRGGHGFVQLRIAHGPMAAPRRTVDLLAALDADAVAPDLEDLAPGGLLVADVAQGVAGADARLVPLPLARLAKQAGGARMANTVAAGACWALLGGRSEVLAQQVARRFAAADAKVAAANAEALQLGYQAAGRHEPLVFAWPGGKPPGRLLDGAQALAWGALAADCRLVAFYPMSPATGIVAEMAAVAKDFPLAVEQAEDEIAAANMVVGASFAGVRAMTATSGGGFCLMTEALGLAAMTETPVVFIDAMRPGPATGLPTRTGQGDLRFVLHASQDEFPRFVFAPATAAEAYQVMGRAFDLAERFQVPAIVLVDQYLVDSLFTVTDPLPVPGQVHRHLVDDSRMEDPAAYRRFALTDDGISPRAAPCVGKALVKAASDEHDPDGHMTEEAAMRRAMVDKRWAKWPAMEKAMDGVRARATDSDLVLVGWGSTFGAVAEAVDLLRAAGRSVGQLHLTDIWPFPTAQVARALERAGRFWVVEASKTGQMAGLIRQMTGLCAERIVGRYDGRPFAVDDIVSAVNGREV